MQIRKAAVWLLGVCCAATAAAQQVQRTAYLDLRPDGFGKVNAGLEFDVPPPNADVLLERLGEVLGCQPEPAQLTQAVHHARWALYTSGANAFRRRRLTIAGEVRLVPLIEALKERNTGWLMVYVRHPHLGFSDTSGRVVDQLRELLVPRILPPAQAG